MNNSFKKGLVWGVVLWLVGYVAGIVLFFVVPPSLIGWVIMPFAILFTLWVITKKFSYNSLIHYVWLGLGWSAMAVVLDYFLLVQVFKPADGYYKLDIYLYYLFTLVLPAVVGLVKLRKLS